MEAVIKSKRARVAAGGRSARCVTVHMRRVPVLTEGQREALDSLACTAALFGLIMLGGLIEGSTWPM